MGIILEEYKCRVCGHVLQREQPSPEKTITLWDEFTGFLAVGLSGGEHILCPKSGHLMGKIITRPG